MKPIVTHIQSEGFEGICFPAAQRKDKVVIVLSGSNGGMSLTKKCAQFYANHNIPALAVALFKTKETNQNLDRVPIEYIEAAIRWLRQKGYQRIGIDGMSKGSEIALLSATMFPELTCVIARVPSYFVSEGLIAKGKSKEPSGTSCWSYKGEEIPYAPYNARKFHIPEIIWKERELHIIAVNRDKKVTEACIIPVEKINGPVLLLSSVHDSVWPSYESSNYIEKRLTSHDFIYPHKHVAYQYMSHMMATGISGWMKLAFRTERQYGKECNQERIQLEHELIDWVETVWR